MLKVRTPEQNQQRLQLVPMKRMGTAEEVASLVLFLLSDESGYITGAEVAIDRGATLAEFVDQRLDHRGVNAFSACPRS
jgi:3alpha(or 20beta)-hydroxysteroid dehydrogenase